METKKKKPLKFVRSVTRIFIITTRDGRNRVAYQNILKRHVYRPSPITTKKNIYVKPVAHNIAIMCSRTHSRTVIIVIIVVAIFCTMMTFSYIVRKYTQMCLTNIPNDVFRNFRPNYMYTWKKFVLNIK